MANSFGDIFKITTFGESHGGGVGVVIDGCPSGYFIDQNSIQQCLDRRRPGQSHLTSPRNEADELINLSGLSQESVTLGSPLCFFVKNKDPNPGEYKDMNKVYRPSHADYTVEKKYGIVAESGGGRASARETIGRVIAGAVAEQILHTVLPDVQIIAYVDQVYTAKSNAINANSVTRQDVDKSPVRCPDEIIAKQMEALILEAMDSGDSLGGAISCIVRNPPIGLGDPVFGKLEALLAQAMMSIPAVKGFEVGSGFSSMAMKGSEHNDAFISKGGKVGTKTNRSGGIQGGISNGEPIVFRVVFKPVSTIRKSQETVTRGGELETEYTLISGRHDPCVLPRAVPIVESMTAIVLLDRWLKQSIIRSKP